MHVFWIWIVITMCITLWQPCMCVLFPIISPKVFGIEFIIQKFLADVLRKQIVCSCILFVVVVAFFSLQIVCSSVSAVYFACAKINCRLL